jgi:FkbM family methyltransferase
MNFTKNLAKLSRALAPIVIARTPHGPVKIRCSTTKSAAQARDFYGIEPETLAWIDQIPRGERLWDIGANIGLIALYAAKAGLPVTAFEPGADNYASMNENLWLNGLGGEQVSAYCVALSDTSGIGSFHMGDPRAGGALHAFGVPENFAGAFKPKFSQAMLGLSVDDAIANFGFPPPVHIKLDVDSIEDKILLGASKTLLGVKSLLMEIESGRTEAWKKTVYDALEAAGLRTKDPTARNVLFVR